PALRLLRAGGPARPNEPHLPRPGPRPRPRDHPTDSLRRPGSARLRQSSPRADQARSLDEPPRSPQEVPVLQGRYQPRSADQQKTYRLDRRPPRGLPPGGKPLRTCDSDGRSCPWYPGFRPDPVEEVALL